MATTTKVLYNDLIAIERSLLNLIPCDEPNVYSGTVKAISIFVTQAAVDDVVLYKRFLTYTEDGNSFDLAHQSETFLRNEPVILP